MIVLSDLWIIGFTYVFMTTFENALHRASHYSLSGPMYRWHRIHHRDYPPARVESEAYLNSTGHHNFYLYAILVVCSIIYWVSTTRTFLIFFTEATVYALTVNYFHESFHVTHTRWDDYRWYQRIKHDHLLHHKNTRVNFNFFDSTSDKFRGTYLIASTDFHSRGN